MRSDAARRTATFRAFVTASASANGGAPGSIPNEGTTTVPSRMGDPSE